MTTSPRPPTPAADLKRTTIGSADSNLAVEQNVDESFCDKPAVGIDRSRNFASDLRKRLAGGPDMEGVRMAAESVYECHAQNSFELPCPSG